MLPCSGKRGRTARFALLWAVLSFVGWQVLVSAGLACWRANLGDAAYRVKVSRLRARLQEAPGRPLVLLLGSSRTLVGMRAGRLHHTPDGRPAVVFNFGLQGGGPLLQLLCLRRLLDDGIRPELLYVEVLPLLLNQPGPHPLEEEWLKGDRLTLPELLASRPYHSEPSRLGRQWARSLLPGGLQRTALHDYLPGEHAFDDWANWMDGHGWNHHFLAAVTSERRRWMTEQALRQYSVAVGSFHPADGAVQALQALLDLCWEQRIAVVLFHMPEGTAFRALYSPALRAGLDGLVAEVQRRWDLPLIDAREWVADDGFWDSHHLLPAAADQFTDRFERRAAELAAAPRPSPTQFTRLQ